jgi:hypothetical protein
MMTSMIGPSDALFDITLHCTPYVVLSLQIPKKEQQNVLTLPNVSECNFMKFLTEHQVTLITGQSHILGPAA